MTKHCLYCGLELTGKRLCQKKFCCPKHKALWHKKNRNSPFVTDNSGLGFSDGEH